MDYRVNEIGDVSNAINSFFIERPLDLNSKFYLKDTTSLNNPEKIYSFFLSSSMVNILYLVDPSLGDLYNQPSMFAFPSLETTDQNMHYIKFNNYLLGAAIYIENTTMDASNYAKLNNIYEVLQTKTIANSTNSSSQNYGNLSVEELEKEWPDNKVLKRSNDQAITLLLPGNINSTVATFIINKIKPYLNDYSNFIKEITVVIYFFNPISEIVLQVKLSYQRTLQGTLSFENSIHGGFPLAYASHQYGESIMKLYFSVKITFLSWTILMFLYDFLTV